VVLNGDSAVMTGDQVDTVRLRETSDGPVQVDSQVMQVWHREGPRWQQVAFRATPTGVPPTTGRN
jgi:hypothetical protein